MPRLDGEEEPFVLLAMHETLVERDFPSPTGRKTIAQRFIAGFPGAKGTSPVRDERGRWMSGDFRFEPELGPSPILLSPLRGLEGFVGRCPSDESLGHFRSSQPDSLWRTRKKSRPA